ncbi:uncharacterized protein [Dermacentor albipictus]|uniref:uncharacterized protein isoform X2 n=1 Tax=Dermacentor albipictus TaxID=60249 RepID=UPI0031FCE038
MAERDREEQQAEPDTDDEWVLLRNHGDGADEVLPGEQHEGKTTEEQSASQEVGLQAATDARTNAQLTVPDRHRRTCGAQEWGGWEPAGPLSTKDLGPVLCYWLLWPLVSPVLPAAAFGLDLAVALLSRARLYSAVAERVCWLVRKLRVIRSRYLYASLAFPLVLLLNALLFNACVVNALLLLRGIAEVIAGFVMANLLATYGSFSKYLACTPQGPTAVALLDSCPTSPNDTALCWRARLYAWLAESERGRSVEAMYEYSEGSFYTFMAGLIFAAGVFSLVLIMAALDALKKGRRMYSCIIVGAWTCSAYHGRPEASAAGRVHAFCTAALQWLAGILVSPRNRAPKPNAKCAASSRSTDSNTEPSRTPNAAEAQCKERPSRRQRHRRRRAVKALREDPGHRSAED